MTRHKHQWLQPKPYLWVRLHVGRVELDKAKGGWAATFHGGGSPKVLPQVFKTAFAAKQHLDDLALKWGGK